MHLGSRRAIVNPQSGTGDHAEYVSRLLRGRGFEVRETAYAEHAVELAREAGKAGVSELAVVGGDGTVNEVLHGLLEAGAIGEVTLSVVPAGTANLLAGNVGVRDLRHGVEVADTGDVRSVDVGLADGEPFVVSCIAGLPADASTATSSDLKSRLGTLAFLVTGAQEALEFDGLSLSIEGSAGDRTTSWEGDAICVLVGNARRFVEEGGQADMEDGLFDVAVVEQVPTGNLVAEAVRHRLLGEGSDSVTHFTAAEVHIATSDGDDLTFSLDGELRRHDRVDIAVHDESLDLRVGPDYRPSPTDG
jgi:diacylglycerol kinase (ATP)